MRRAFYPSSCCAPIGRRAFLGGAVATAATLAAGRPAAAALMDDTKAIVLADAPRPDDPWLVAHGIRAMGADFKLDRGRSAVEFLLTGFLEEQTVKGRAHLAFPLKVEVHPNMFLKTLLEAGVPPSFRFTLKGKSRTLQEVVDGAHALFRFSDQTGPNAIPWSLIALSLTTPPARQAWTNAWAEKVQLSRVVSRGLAALEQASRPIEEARAQNRRIERQAPVHGSGATGSGLQTPAREPPPDPLGWRPRRWRRPHRWVAWPHGTGVVRAYAP